MEVGVERQVGLACGVEVAGRERRPVTPAIRPSSRPTVANASSARSSWASAWAAVTIVRIRALSIATVGNTTGWAKTPSSNRRWLNRPAVSGSPIITGVIGVSERPVSKPEPGELGLEAPRVRPEPLVQLRLLLHDPDRLAAGGGDRRRMGRREQERAGRAG